MEHVRAVPRLAPAEAEEFFATGSDARLAAPGLEPGPVSSTSSGGAWRTGTAGVGSERVPAGGASELEAARNAAASAQTRDIHDEWDAVVAGPDLRCGECRNLRHASPKHKLGCRYAFQNCPGCVYAGEAHLASCPIAALLKLPTDDCCEGVDLPGADGPVHSPDCKNPRPVVRASETLPEAQVRPMLLPRGAVRAHVQPGELVVSGEGERVYVSLNDGWTTYILTPRLAKELQAALACLLADVEVAAAGGVA